MNLSFSLVSTTVPSESVKHKPGEVMKFLDKSGVIINSFAV